MILVAGATGQLGQLIAHKLLARGESVRILVRDGSNYEALVAAGAEPVRGDLKDPDSLRAACRGVAALVTTANATARGGEDTIESVDRAGNRNLIDAAGTESVRHVVFVSSLGAAPDHPMPLLRAKGEAEQQLRDSGMAWTVLQPNLFLDKLPMAVVGGPALAGQPITLIGEGRRRHSMIAMRDAAAYAVAALETPKSEEQTLVIGGPRPLSWHDIVTEFEEVLGTPLPVRTVPIGQPVPGMPDFLSDLLTALEAYDSPIDSSALASTYGVTPTRLGDFVRDFVADSDQRVP